MFYENFGTPRNLRPLYFENHNMFITDLGRIDVVIVFATNTRTL
jgi:hypothetical protein